MNTETKPKFQDAIASVQKAVDQAARVSRITQEMKEAGINFETYKHPLTKPFSYEGATFEVLEFDWTILTGQDSLAIEAELAKKQKTLVNALWSEDYLAGMAVRACTWRGQVGQRISAGMLEALPIADYAGFEETILAAHRAAQPGDVVLLSPACASFDKFKNFMERGAAFKAIVNSLTP